MKALTLVALLLAGCAGSASQTKGGGAQKSLYERLGGQDAIATVVGVFIGKIDADQRINARFANTDRPHFKAMLIEQLCEATGGPCKYTGKDMKAAHTGQQVTNDEFDALVEDLQAALTECKVGTDEQKQLVSALAPMRGDVVGH